MILRNCFSGEKGNSGQVSSATVADVSSGLAVKRKIIPLQEFAVADSEVIFNY